MQRPFLPPSRRTPRSRSSLKALRAGLPCASHLPIQLGERAIGNLSIGMSTAKVRSETSRTIAFVVAVNLALAVALGVAMLLAIQRIVITPLGGEPAYAADVARRVAEGDLGFAIETRGGDEKSAMAALRLMVAKLAEVTAQVRAAVGRGRLGGEPGLVVGAVDVAGHQRAGRLGRGDDARASRR